MRTALEMLGFGRCTHPELLPALLHLAEGGGAGEDSTVAAEACRVLRHFPPDVRRPLFRRILHTSLALPVSLPRDIALDQLGELEPGGPQASREILENLLARGALRHGERDSEDSSFATSSEEHTRVLLLRLLASPIETQALFQALAGARRPDLRPFAPRLRERLGGEPLEPETLEALHAGLASREPLRCANARTLFLCAPAQAPLAEPGLVALLTSLEEPTRTQAAEALYALERLGPPSACCVWWPVWKTRCSV
ncbi:hypothetical protein [Melittangium boletus]|uniref:hypothetical protein n=1 Tax=Melittangium boletus TaxID=83453 RepID=UPI003DA57FA0